MFEKIICTIFRISTLVFLLGGVVIVVGQAGGILVGNGEFVTGFEETMAPWVYGASGVAGLLAFALMYFHPEADYTGSEHDDAAGTSDSDVKASGARHAPEHA
jgi:hypothetical protein